jgi:hypothetical protein
LEAIELELETNSEMLDFPLDSDANVATYVFQEGVK